MADVTEHSEQEDQTTASQTTHNRNTDHIDYEMIVRTVATLLNPMIQEAVDASLQQGLMHFKKEMAASGKRMREIKQRVSRIEDNMQHNQSTVTVLDSTILYLTEKLDDLENRSRRNNLRIIGPPEQYKTGELQDLCAETITLTLGIKSGCMVESAHRMGVLHPDRETARQVIV